jgi:hypothetical protein
MQLRYPQNYGDIFCKVGTRSSGLSQAHSAGGTILVVTPRNFPTLKIAGEMATVPTMEADVSASL